MLTTGQSANPAVNGGVKRGSFHLKPKASLKGGEEAAALGPRLLIRPLSSAPAWA